jgi:hypothetical protein
MIRRLLLLSGVLALTLSSLTASQTRSDLTVHEWGTFTSVAAADGTAVEWSPQSGPVDLPCFVRRMPSFVKLWMPGTVRMETPVLYFYSPRDTQVDVRVSFRRGAITEWFPNAGVSPANVTIEDLRSPEFVGSIAWRNVKVAPSADASFPTDGMRSHYYAARRTEASPIEVNGERERFLFYRGVGSFAPPFTAVVNADGGVSVANPTGEPVGDVMLFENRRGVIRYDLRHATTSRVTLRATPIDDESPMPFSELEQMLVAHGLFAKEAKAMVDTWRDSWFEEGARIFYMTPRKTVDHVLPLAITPAPARVERVFVGRLELVTPSIAQEVRDAIVASDAAVLGKHGRFIDPILARLSPPVTAAERLRSQNLMAPIRQQWFASLSACK